MFLLIIIISCTINLKSQNYIYPKGVYTCSYDLKSKTPSANFDIIVSKTTNNNKKSNCNDYVLESRNKSIKKKYLKEDIFAYSDGKNLYINCLKFNSVKAYSKVISAGGNFLIYKSNYLSEEHHNNIINAGAFFGIIGSTIYLLLRLKN